MTFFRLRFWQPVGKIWEFLLKKTFSENMIFGVGVGGGGGVRVVLGRRYGSGSGGVRDKDTATSLGHAYGGSYNVLEPKVYI